MSIVYGECYPDVEGSAIPMEFLLKVMRMGHTILGITAPPPEHERAFLLGWIVSLLLLFAFGIGLLLFLVPRIMR